MFMTPTIAYVTPATLSRVICLHLPDTMFTWKEFLKTKFLELYQRDRTFACSDLMWKLRDLFIESLEGIFGFKRKPIEYCIDISKLEIVRNIWKFLEMLLDDFSKKRPDGGGIGQLPAQYAYSLRKQFQMN